MPAVTSLDHLVLTVADIDTMIAFYSDLLGTIEKQFQPKAGTIRWALKFGDQKINPHVAESPFCATCKDPGSEKR
ncbi:MAG: catechol 2,3-dioxygenase-like lactoylglutathione lyase family enzyme [Yoonia sp.]|jgi:catechol 2,3-dioxygenase-like lactoylglutathione lyase family enzyme